MGSGSSRHGYQPMKTMDGIGNQYTCMQGIVMAKNRQISGAQTRMNKREQHTYAYTGNRHMQNPQTRARIGEQQAYACANY